MIFPFIIMIVCVEILFLDVYPYLSMIFILFSFLLCVFQNLKSRKKKIDF